MTIKPANPIRYAVKVTSDHEEHRLYATFAATDEDIVNHHPLDIFGTIFRETLMEAATAFSDRNVREVPIYQAGVLEPIAYLTRA